MLRWTVSQPLDLPWQLHLQNNPVAASPVPSRPPPLPATSSSSAIPNPSIDEQARIGIAQWMRAAYPSFLANTDDELDGEEEQPKVTRRPKIISGKLRTADTTAVKHVLWLHELVFTPEGRPTVYGLR